MSEMIVVWNDAPNVGITINIDSVKYDLDFPSLLSAIGAKTVLDEAFGHHEQWVKLRQRDERDMSAQAVTTQAPGPGVGAKPG